jgi:hypothetical protein
MVPPSKTAGPLAASAIAGITIAAIVAVAFLAVGVGIAIRPVPRLDKKDDERTYSSVFTDA